MCDNTWKTERGFNNHTCRTGYATCSIPRQSQSCGGGKVMQKQLIPATPYSSGSRRTPSQQACRGRVTVSERVSTGKYGPTQTQTRKIEFFECNPGMYGAFDSRMLSNYGQCYSGMGMPGMSGMSGMGMPGMGRRGPEIVTIDDDDY